MGNEELAMKKLIQGMDARKAKPSRYTTPGVDSTAQMLYETQSNRSSLETAKTNLAALKKLIGGK
jgi:hypothetical protein